MAEFKGETLVIPGVYSESKVQEGNGVIASVFDVPIAVGEHFYGPQYPTSTPNLQAAEITDVIQEYPNPTIMQGKTGLNYVTRQFKQLRKKSATSLFAIFIGKLTKSTVTLKDGAGTPANSIVLTSVLAGQPTMFTHVEVVTTSENTTVNITPPSNIIRLTSDGLTGSEKIVVESVENLFVGQNLFIGTKASTVGHWKAVTIVSINATTKVVTLDATLGQTYYTVANNAHLFIKDIANQKSKTFTTAEFTLNNVIEFIESTGILNASAATSATLPPDDIAFFIGMTTDDAGDSVSTQISSQTLGTSTALTGSEWEAFCTNDFYYLVDKFKTQQKIKIRHVLVGAPDNPGSVTGIHGYFRTLASTMRASGWPIQLHMGIKLGDALVATSLDNHPWKQALALNSGNVLLSCVGLDGEDPFLTLTPQVLGAILANPTNHNLTNDELICSKVEKFFGDSTREEMKKWLVKGCIIPRATENGFVIAQGLTTYQDHSLQWNVNTGDTYLVKLRQLADKWDNDVKNQFTDAPGADGLTKATLMARATNFINFKVNEGEVLSNTKIDEVKKISGGWALTFSVSFPDTDDFITITSKIVQN